MATTSVSTLQSLLQALMNSVKPAIAAQANTPSVQHPAISFPSQIRITDIIVQRDCEADAHINVIAIEPVISANKSEGKSIELERVLPMEIELPEEDILRLVIRSGELPEGSAHLELTKIELQMCLNGDPSGTGTIIHQLMDANSGESLPFVGTLSIQGIATKLLSSPTPSITSLEGFPPNIQLLYSRIQTLLMKPDSESKLANSRTLHAICMMIGNTFLLQFKEKNQPSDVDNAISAYENALTNISREDPAVVHTLLGTGNALWARFMPFKQREDADRALRMFQDTVDLTPDGDPSAENLRSNLTLSLETLYELTGDVDVLDALISVHRKIVGLVPRNPSAKPSSAHLQLAKSLETRFKKTGDLKDIDQAISVQQAVVDLIDGSVPSEKAFQLTELGGRFETRFEHTKDLRDIDNAIREHRSAVELMPDDHPLVAAQHCMLGICFQNRFQHTKSLSDINEAIAATKKGALLMPQRNVHLPGTMNNLGDLLLHRFELTGEQRDIDAAVYVHETAVLLTPESHHLIPIHRSHFGASLLSRYRYFGNSEDIDKSISENQKAVDLTPEGDEYLPSALNNLANALSYRFQRTGNLEYANEAVSTRRRVADLTLDGDIHAGSRMSNLGVTLNDRFTFTGALEDLDDAIAAHQKAVNLTPTDNADFSLRLINLTSALSHRFHLIGNQRDLEEAIIAQRQAVLLSSSKNHEVMAVQLGKLGSLLNCRFECTRNFADLDEAIISGKKSVDLTPESHSDIPLHLSNFAISLLSRFRSKGDLADIDEAIAAHRKAIGLCPVGHADLLRQLDCLGAALITRFKHLRDMRDADEAVSLQQRSVELTPPGHFYVWAQRVKNIGTTYSHRFAVTNDMTDVKNSVAQYRLVALSSESPPSTRLACAQQWAMKAFHFETPTESLMGWSFAIELLPRVAWLGHTVTDRHAQLALFSELSTSAATRAIDCSEPALALQWLEQGRCIVWNQLNSLRTPLDELCEVQPGLVAEIMEVSAALELAGARATEVDMLGDMFEKIAIQDQVKAQHELATRWDALVRRVRAVKGFEGFLCPIAIPDMLKSVLDSSAVVVINVHPAACDALVLVSGSDTVVNIPLDKISFHQAERLQKLLRKCLSMNGVRTRENRLGRMAPISSKETEPGMQYILEQLWVGVVKPILDRLGFSTPSSSPESRIWWCPTGPLAFLPIHAAGIYGKKNEGIGSVVGDYVLSSYTPTVSSLITAVKEYKKRTEAGIIGANGGILAVSQPNTPNLAPIPNTVKECQSIRDEFMKANIEFEYLEGSAATIANVIDKMKRRPWIHLAIYASQDPEQPTKSAFHLHDGSLELSALIQKSFPIAEFAFLSACQTSTGDMKLSNEAVHLAAGMLAAGYLGVVASMWSIEDEHAPMVAGEFYRQMLNSSGPDEFSARLGSSHSAYALQHAVKRLRETVGDTESGLVAWVPFMHIGL